MIFFICFALFFCPFPRGGACFCLVFWSQVPTKHGGERVFLNMFCQIGGQNVFCQIFAAKHGGQMGVKYVVPCFFFSEEVFGLFPVATAGQARKKKQQKKKKKKQKTKGEKNNKKKNRNKKNEKKKGTKRKEKKKKKKKKKKKRKSRGRRTTKKKPNRRRR